MPLKLIKYNLMWVTAFRITFKVLAQVPHQFSKNFPIRIENNAMIGAPTTSLTRQRATQSMIAADDLILHVINIITPYVYI